jgi:hypothetical protein
MSYRLHWTDWPVSPQAYQSMKSHLLTASYHELDDALGRARQIDRYGGVAWEIVGEDGRSLDRHQIARTLQDRAAELVGRPKVY